MKINKKTNSCLLEKIFIFALFLFTVVNVSCQKSEDEIFKVQIIKNSGKPSKPLLRIELREIMSIQEEWCDYGGIFLDEDKNIIYWVERDKTVYKINNDGNTIFKKKFTQGKGYGDIYFFDFEEWNGKYYVFDKFNNRLNIFDKEFNLVESNQIERDEISKGRYVLRIDEIGNLYFISEENSYRKGCIYADISIANFGKKGKRKKVEFFRQSSKLYDRTKKRMLSYWHHQPFLRYLIGDDGRVWICDRREYKIYSYLPNGKLDRVIEKEYRKIKIKGEAEKKYKEEYGIERIEKLGTEVILPEYICPLMDILLIDNDYILVLRMDYIFREDKSGKILADLFDREGKFLNQIEFPEFYGCYHLGNQFKTDICYKNGYLYSIEADEELEKFFIKKYEFKVEE